MSLFPQMSSGQVSTGNSQYLKLHDYFHIVFVLSPDGRVPELRAEGAGVELEVVAVSRHCVVVLINENSIQL